VISGSGSEFVIGRPRNVSCDAAYAIQVTTAAETAIDLIQRAVAALQRRALDEAAVLAATALQRFGPEANALMVLASVRVEQGNLQEATHLYERARALMPTHIHVLVNLAALYRVSGRLQEARRALEDALQTDPRFAIAHHNLGNVLADLGASAASQSAYERAAALDPTYPDPVASLAWHALEEHRLTEARTLAERAQLLAPRNVLAQLTAARVKLREHEPAAAVALCEGVLNQGTLSVTNRIIAQGSVAEAYDQLQRFDEAFMAYTKANELQLEQCAATFAHARGTLSPTGIARLTQFVAKADCSGWSPAPDTQSTPTFLVGFPRSGTTLLEQILASHPQLTTLEEHDTLDEAASQMMGSDAALERWASLPGVEVERLRTLYWQRVHAAVPAPLRAVFVDKQPLNAVMLPLIYRLFPNTRIILVLRDPRDVLLSCFQQRFGMNEAMYQLLRLDTAAEYYDAVMRLVRLSRERFPLRVYVIKYEDVLADFERTMRGALGFLGLGWDVNLLSYAETARRRRINTPSAEQVVRPLYGSARGKWRNYRRYLEPYLAALSPWVNEFGYGEG
jgi:tetratricopeptide (TPR) repeat protein